jgi:NTP pyrophosphatase (non-canonical NTP hydrolase)
MNFKDYQEKSKKTAIYPNKGENYIYPVLGLSGEAGEVSEKFKKIIRDKESHISKADKEEIEKELGDVLWYLSQIASELNLDLSKIAQKNLEKLKKRQEKGLLQGSGDNR